MLEEIKVICSTRLGRTLLNGKSLDEISRVVTNLQPLPISSSVSDGNPPRVQGGERRSACSWWITLLTTLNVLALMVKVWNDLHGATGWAYELLKTKPLGEVVALISTSPPTGGIGSSILHGNDSNVASPPNPPTATPSLSSSSSSSSSNRLKRGISHEGNQVII